MAGKIGKLKIGPLFIKGVFRHKWDDPDDSYHTKIEYKTKKLGIFFRKDMCIGTTKKGRDMFTRDNHYPSYMFGLNLIWAKCWITIDWKVLHF